MQLVRITPVGGVTNECRPLCNEQHKEDSGHPRRDGGPIRRHIRHRGRVAADRYQVRLLPGRRRRHRAEDQNGYIKVQRAILDMRRADVLPWSWIVDNTRWMQKPTPGTPSRTRSRTSARRTARRSGGKLVAVEVWCESESVAGVLYPATSKWDVPLYPVRVRRLTRSSIPRHRPTRTTARARHLLRRRPRPSGLRDRVEPRGEAHRALWPRRHRLHPLGLRRRRRRRTRPYRDTQRSRAG